MTNSETQILRHFRLYHAGVGEMLFFDTGPAKSHLPQFYHAMESLARSGFVVKERHPSAYSLTPLGFRASQSA